MPYTDWIEAMDNFIPDKKNLSLIEFGLGDGTEYLLNNFKNVYSYELMNTDYWYNISVNKFSKFENWRHRLVLWRDINFVDDDTNLPKQLLDDIDDLFENNKYDVVFMDGGYHVRGDIVDVIINKFSPKYVVIHDTNFAFVADGYHRMNIPQNYSTEKSTNGEGTMIFIKQN